MHHMMNQLKTAVFMKGRPENWRKSFQRESGTTPISLSLSHDHKNLVVLLGLYYAATVCVFPVTFSIKSSFIINKVLI